MSADWSLDFCLVCDQQTSGAGPYCSQSCRLADLDQNASESSLSSYPVYLSSKSTLQSKTSSVSSTQSGSSTVSRQPSGKRSSSSFSTSSNEQSSSLTSTSSQTSLSSLTSTLSPSAALSNQVRHELQDYSKSFDQVRDWKRRLTNS
ncbi:hypothetical protein DPV78_009368 [Talaromyces pinophilus]|nr:hypothetical protein DPV78_009368 [Talaromyces pinophilus]